MNFPSLNKPTAEQILEKLTPKSLRKCTITQHLNRMTKRERKRLRQIVTERYRFYRSLRQLVGVSRMRRSSTLRARQSSLQLKTEQSGSGRWTLQDATTVIRLGGNRVVIPTIQRFTLGPPDYIDLRIWTVTEEEDGTQIMYPTRKGICIRMEFAEQLMDSIKSLLYRHKRRSNDT